MNTEHDTAPQPPSRTPGAPEPDYAGWLQPVPQGAVFRDPAYNIWCGSPVQDDDGRWHLFHARWPRSSTHHGWLTHSEIARATSDTMFGPYQTVDVVLPARGPAFWDGVSTFNPTVLRVDGRYLLYYTGVNGEPGGERPNWGCRNSQRIGVAVADRPEGPWQRFDAPLIDTSDPHDNPDAPDTLMTSNPAVCRRPGGGWLMLYKGVATVRPLPFGGPVVLLLATADHPAGPFKKSLQPMFTLPAENFAAEDPFIWHDGQRYRAIVKDMRGCFTRAGCSLAHFSSDDGYAWAPAPHPLVSTLEIVFAAEGRRKLAALERPQLVLEHGVPVALFCAAADGADRDASYNVHIPLAQAAAG